MVSVYIANTDNDGSIFYRRNRTSPKSISGSLAQNLFMRSSRENFSFSD